MNEYFDATFQDIKVSYPQLTIYEHFQLVNILLPKKISPVLHNRAYSAFNDDDRQISSEGAKAFFYLNLKTFITIVEHYRDIPNVDIEDLFHSAVTQGLSGLHNQGGYENVSIPQRVYAQAMKGVHEYLHIESDIPEDWITAKNLKIFRDIDDILYLKEKYLNDTIINGIAKELSATTGLSTNLIKNYIRLRYKLMERDSQKEPQIDEDSVFKPAYMSTARTDLIEIMTELGVTQREQNTLFHLHGLIDGIEYTLEEEGERQGVTSDRIRQIRDRALEKLQKREINRLRGYLNTSTKVSHNAQ